jgi:hypothetical protein
MGVDFMRLMHLPAGASGAILRIVIGAFIGGSIGVGFGWWFYIGLTRELGSETWIAVLILLFTVPIGICLGGAGGVVVAFLSDAGPDAVRSDTAKSINRSGLPCTDDFGLD